MTSISLPRISKVDLWLIRLALHYLRNLAESDYQEPEAVNRLLTHIRSAEANFAVATEDAFQDSQIAFTAADVNAATISLRKMLAGYQNESIAPALAEVLKKLTGESV